MNNRGFTIIETFVAVTILLVAVLGPLSILGRAVADETYLKNQLIATYLAQEGIELVINRKDNNMILLNAPLEPGGQSSAIVDSWLTGMEDCLENSGCKIVFDSDRPSASFGFSQGEGKMCLTGGLYKDCGDSDPNTPFVRTIKIQEEIALDPPRADIVSSVTWNQRGVSRTVEVKSTVYNYGVGTF